MVWHRRIRATDLAGMRIKGEEEAYRSFGMGRESTDGCTGKRKHGVSGCRLSLEGKGREGAGKVAQIPVGRSILQEQPVQASKGTMQVTRKQTRSCSPET